jgi:hypothetical protein
MHKVDRDLKPGRRGSWFQLGHLRARSQGSRKLPESFPLQTYVIVAEVGYRDNCDAEEELIVAGSSSPFLPRIK